MLVSATLNPDKVSRFGPNTGYQVYQHASDGVIDFTDKKLNWYAETASPADKITLKVIIEQYRKGEVAVSWRRGKPTWIRVKSELG